MNLYQLLKKELDEFDDEWTAKEKADYIYIRLVNYMIMMKDGYIQEI